MQQGCCSFCPPATLFTPPHVSHVTPRAFFWSRPAHFAPYPPLTAAPGIVCLILMQIFSTNYLKLRGSALLQTIGSKCLCDACVSRGSHTRKRVCVMIRDTYHQAVAAACCWLLLAAACCCLLLLAAACCCLLLLAAAGCCLLLPPPFPPLQPLRRRTTTK